MYSQPPGGYPPNNPPHAGSVPYQGGFPVRCPRCSHVVSSRFCTFCGMDLSLCYTTNRPAPPPPGQNPYYGQTVSRSVRRWTPLRITALVCGIVLAAALLASAFYIAIRFLKNPVFLPETLPPGEYDPPAFQQEYSLPNGVSLDEYRQIREGMSYARVSQIIGGDGILYETQQSLQDEIKYTYIWYGENSPYAAAYITFTNGAVTEIANEGLTDGQ